MPFTRVQMEATLLALQAWSDVANITFVRQDDGGGYSNHATMLFGAYSSGADGAAAFAALPGSTASSSVAGDVWINGSLSYNAAPTVGGYGHLALVHEIGHAIGLLHPGDYDADPGVQITYREHADYYEDSNQYTVMSYFSEVATGAQFGAGRYVSAPMLDDIAAAQRLYGANYETRSGDTVYGFNSTADRPWFSAVAGGQAPVFAVWDGGGTDTLDFSGYAFAQVIDLRQGG
ncbi:M10 family metallopeptidase C-terminal domain-containing protein, partial [Brevundimonas sp.]|uniref:M10 family metallopeptidase C-terminal domain-containing protein n=1 Tax=Brevundimonas sp. TaxID=1871086 RepID=UPI0025C6CA1E